MACTAGTDSLVVAFDQALQAKRERVGIENLTVEERTVLAIEELERDVNNDGFDHLFLNVSPDLTSIIGSSLQRIGCERTAAVVREAIAANEIDDTDRRELELNRCDERFYALDEDIAEALFAFISRNRAVITTG